MTHQSLNKQITVSGIGSGPYAVPPNDSLAIKAQELGARLSQSPEHAGKVDRITIAKNQVGYCTLALIGKEPHNSFVVHGKNESELLQAADKQLARHFQTDNKRHTPINSGLNSNLKNLTVPEVA